MNRRRFFAAPAALLPLTAPNATLVASPARAHITLTFDQTSLAKSTESVKDGMLRAVIERERRGA